MTNYVEILKRNASPDVIAANPELFDSEQLSAAVSAGSTGHVSTPFVPSEHDEQAALFAWADLKQAEWPELANLYAIPNGQYRKGQRMEPGLKSGVPDMFLAWPAKMPWMGSVRLSWYHGLYIELKKRNGRSSGVSDNQVDWITRLREARYRAEVCYGCREAQRAIADYLGRELS